MEIAKEQKELLMKCMDSIDAVRIFRKLFWKWYEGPVRLLGESTRDQLRQLREFMCAEDKVGLDTMPYVMAMLYYGRDLLPEKSPYRNPMETIMSLVSANSSSRNWITTLMQTILISPSSSAGPMIFATGSNMP